jgi:hypothetical protein
MSSVTLYGGATSFFESCDITDAPPGNQVRISIDA